MSADERISQISCGGAFFSVGKNYMAGTAACNGACSIGHSIRRPDLTAKAVAVLGSQIMRSDLLETWPNS